MDLGRSDNFGQTINFFHPFPVLEVGIRPILNPKVLLGGEEARRVLDQVQVTKSREWEFFLLRETTF